MRKVSTGRQRARSKRACGDSNLKVLVTSNTEMTQGEEVVARQLYSILQNFAPSVIDFLNCTDRKENHPRLLPKGK